MSFCFFFNDTATTEIYTLSLHDALPIYLFRFDDDLDGELVRNVQLIRLAAIFARRFGRLAVPTHIAHCETAEPCLLELRGDSRKPLGSEDAFDLHHREPTSSRSPGPVRSM